MKIALALCGNNYSKSIVSGVADPNIFYIYHESNRKLKIAFLLRYFVISFALLLRYLSFIVNIEFIIYAPHLARNYGKIFKIFRPDAIVLIDDGITYEYWSDFHEKYIASLLRSKLPLDIVGPHRPNWGCNLNSVVNFYEINRKDIMRIMSKNAIISNNCMHGDQKRISILIDDGVMSRKCIESVSKYLKSNFPGSVEIICHPARLPSKDLNYLKLNEPVEVYYMRNSRNISSVFGNGSTALFNIVSVSLATPVYSFETTINELNISMNRSGILLLNRDFLNACN